MTQELRPFSSHTRRWQWTFTRRGHLQSLTLPHLTAASDLAQILPSNVCTSRKVPKFGRSDNTAHGSRHKTEHFYFDFLLLHRITFFSSTMTILKVTMCGRIIWKMISTSGSSNVAIMHAVLFKKLSEYEDNIGSKSISLTLLFKCWSCPVQ